MWVEVNTRVNYPIKRILQEMVENNEIDMANEMHKYCTSWLVHSHYTSENVIIFCSLRFAMNVASVGLQLFVSSWNNHPIPGQHN